jgi:hypothetical protein
MTWRSPWQSPEWLRATAVARGDLLNRSGSDHKLIERLVETNNRRVATWLADNPSTNRRVMMILPRCVRRNCCRPGPGGDLAQSLHCSSCQLGELARAADRRQVHAFVAFRSHLAYDAARRERPDLIIATACEDRLFKALSSVPDIPALLSPLTRMERMCVGADFNAAWFVDMLNLVSPEVAACESRSRASTGT